MDTSLRNHLQCLNLSQYVQVLEANGYHDWSEIMRISEHDLDRLGFKLGHRRRLQREIASAQGYPPSAALPWCITEPGQVNCNVSITTLYTSALYILSQESSTLMVDETVGPTDVRKRTRSSSMELSDENMNQAEYITAFQKVTYGQEVLIQRTKKHKRTQEAVILQTVYESIQTL